MKRIVMLIIILGVTLCYILPTMADGDVKATMSNQRKPEDYRGQTK